ncbi:MAG: M1 family metallopeptidase [Bacteroidia bacterium]
MIKHLLFSTTILSFFVGFSQVENPENVDKNKFRQMYQEYATPNVYRTAGGAPGHGYYQQKADYVMNIVLDDAKQTITGEETITYYNNSPDKLEYLWLQLDQNQSARDSDSKLIHTGKLSDRMSFEQLERMHNDFDGGFKITSITDVAGKSMKCVVNKTMMRIDLATPLAAKGKITFKIKWWYNINDRMKVGGRSGYEYFEKDGNYLYTIAQFFPRMCVYNDVEGWQNKQFLGAGEFTLTFGDYDVKITVPDDHIVGATGELQNMKNVYSAEHIKRWEQAKKETVNPVIIVTQKEAEENEKDKSTKTKTWHFKATNVRDFAFASSRKFIVDAMTVKQNSRDVLALSYYPKEGNPLWEKYSTKAVAHTLKIYSKHTFDYPYPVAISVHSKNIGMEYPMICFNGGRPEEDGTYSDRTKYAMIGVIIHEVGHNYFPMIVNSDERQWTWMDEGLNTFLQYLTEQEWERDYPSRRGPAFKIVDYMKGDKSGLEPIMTNSESIMQFGNNAYGKPATALNILRETVMGRELFDHAFKMYSQRWMFKHPTPEDLFRTMEDASGVDLDWFWRGWFYTTDHVDISLENVKWYKIDSKNPEVEFPKKREEAKADDERFIGNVRNKTDIKETYSERDPSILDFYNKHDQFEVTSLDKEDYEKYLAKLSDNDRKLLNSGYNYYELSFKNIGGLVMPVIVEFTYNDGTKHEVRIPAEIWMKNNYEVSKVFPLPKEVIAIRVDPHLETADTDIYNNYWPRMVQPTRFELFKAGDSGWGGGGENLMQRHKRAEEKK